MNFPGARRITPQERLAEIQKYIREGNAGGALNELSFLESELIARATRGELLVADMMTAGPTFYRPATWAARVRELIRMDI